MSRDRRRTKIVATIGPASESPRVLAQLMEAGMDVARLNLSHGSLEGALVLYDRIRRVAAEKRRELGILADLPGPKIRMAPFGPGGAMLEQDAEVILRPGSTASDTRILEVDYERLLDDVKVGDRVGLADGQILIEIASVGSDALRGRVLHGGLLRGRPGCYIPADRLSIATPTEQDLRYAEALVEVGVDFLGASFVRGPDDVRALRVAAPTPGPLLVAKIETRLAVENIDAIITEADAIMVARGDLGIEFPIEDLPHLQKDIIRRCIARGTPCHHRHTDAGVHDRVAHSDAGRSLRCGERGLRRLQRRHALRRDGDRCPPCARRGHNGSHRRGGRWSLRPSSLGTEHHAVAHDQSHESVAVGHRCDDDGGFAGGGGGGPRRADLRLGQRLHRSLDGALPPPRAGARLQRRPANGPSADTQLGGRAGLPRREIAYESRVADAVEAAVAMGRIRAGDLVAILAGINPAMRSTDVLRLLRVPEDLRELRSAPRLAR